MRLEKAFFACDFEKPFKLRFFGGNGVYAFFFGKNRLFFLSLIWGVAI
jgi:hypothetical protein